MVAAQRLDFAWRAVRLRISLVVAEEAAGLDVEQARPAAHPCHGNGLAGGFMYGKEVEAVHLHARHAEGRRAVDDLAAADRPAGGRGLRIAIVFEHEHDGQLPYRGEVKTFEHAALVGAAV